MFAWPCTDSLTAHYVAQQHLVCRCSKLNQNITVVLLREVEQFVVEKRKIKNKKTKISKFLINGYYVQIMRESKQYKQKRTECNRTGEDKKCNTMHIRALNI
jgi:hypothetical protein